VYSRVNVVGLLLKRKCEYKILHSAVMKGVIRRTRRVPCHHSMACSRIGDGFIYFFVCSLFYDAFSQ
jgi:hypothetical protein